MCQHYRKIDFPRGHGLQCLVDSPRPRHPPEGLDCMRCRSEEAEQFCQPCCRWVCTERCWPGDHFEKCWDCVPQRPQLKPNAEGTNRWRIFTRKMMRFERSCWRYAYRQIVDKRIGARRVPPNDWPAGRTSLPSIPWDDYSWDDAWGTDVTDMHGIGSEPPLAQPDLAEPDLAPPDPAEPDL